ncbi:MAG: hypothetical protein ACK5LJ_05825 [Paracoccus sp. (in: a-proteobacteria)]
MTKPLQRILHHHPIVKRHARDFADRAEQIDVARAVIRGELVLLGRSTTPADDRAALIPTDTVTPSIDSADPTGNSVGLGRRWQQLTDDLEALQDLEVEWLDTTGHLLAIAGRYTAAANSTEPRCERCDLAVEAIDRTRQGFRGTHRIGGEWVRNVINPEDPGRPALCGACRKSTERGSEGRRHLKAVP